MSGGKLCNLQVIKFFREIVQSHLTRQVQGFPQSLFSQQFSTWAHNLGMWSVKVKGGGGGGEGGEIQG